MKLLQLELLISCLLILHCLDCLCHDHRWKTDYDYIVVGSGTAGSVVARRLSDDKDVTVLVLEAGVEDKDPFIRIPKTWLEVFFNPELDWGFETEPVLTSPTNQRIRWHQGKVVGGCGSNNALVYTRGSKFDFNRWEELGNYNWSYNAVLPYFKKSERMLDPVVANNGYHGTDGLMSTRTLEKNALVEEFIKAGVEMGLEEIEDNNGPELEGISQPQMNVNEMGERMSPYEAFLKPARSRWNLDLISEARVTKIIFDENDQLLPKAAGVYFVKDGMTHYVSARREVVVSSGVVGSPLVLMNSGIGHKEHLESLGIKVVSDLPVGDNVQEHILGMSFTVTLSDDTPIEVKKMFTFEALFNQLFVGESMWSSEKAAIAFYKSKTQPESDQFPYIEHTFRYPFSKLIQFPDVVNAVRNGNPITNEMISKMVESENGPITMVVSTILQHPRNTGTIRLRSNDPLDQPVINYEYLSHSDDVKDVIEGIRNVQKFLNTTVMRHAKVQPITDIDSNCKSHVFDTDSYWQCAIYNKFETYGHFTSSCKMAPDASGVVDERLRVKGVRGLRVADSSIMPLITTGHPAAPTVMIGEKAADMIKDDNLGLGVVPLPSTGNNLSAVLSSYIIIILIIVSHTFVSQ